MIDATSMLRVALWPFCYTHVGNTGSMVDVRSLDTAALSKCMRKKEIMRYRGLRKTMHNIFSDPDVSMQFNGLSGSQKLPVRDGYS